jgi:hypothetical protein
VPENKTPQEIVLNYLRDKRNGLLLESVGKTFSLKVTPHLISKWADRKKIHTRPFAKPVQYQFLKQLDFLVDEPWLCSADTSRIDVDMNNGISRICYIFTFKNERHGGEINEFRYKQEVTTQDGDNLGVSDSNSTDTQSVG